MGKAFPTCKLIGASWFVIAVRVIASCYASMLALLASLCLTFLLLVDFCCDPNNRSVKPLLSLYLPVRSPDWSREKPDGELSKTALLVVVMFSLSRSFRFLLVWRTRKAWGPGSFRGLRM